MRYKLTEELINEIKEVVFKSFSMRQAAKCFSMDYKTFRSLAKKIGCWNPNQNGKGNLKPRPSTSLEEICKGLHPEYKGYKLKGRLFKKGLKKKICEECGVGDFWNGKVLVLELHHRNGNSKDHRWDNLQILCPNCHSQTPIFRRRIIK
jgi:hypothetical protein